MNRYFFHFFLPLTLLALIYFSACSNSTEPPAPGGGTSPDSVQVIKPVIVNALPHDPDAFTQGLVFVDSLLYESTGLYGESTLRKVDIQSGQVQQSVALGSQYFGEGLALKNNRLVQLTWLNKTAFVYDFSSLAQSGTFSYEGQGWGLTTDSTFFIMSNGSDELAFRNDNFEIIKTVKVTLDGQPLSSLNELEYANSRVYANVWLDNSIYEIIPESGKVSRVIDCAELVSMEDPTDPRGVLNGIAYNPQTNTFYCTGKLWKNMFEIRLLQ
jgi:glutamine cyclotransferase